MKLITRFNATILAFFAFFAFNLSIVAQSLNLASSNGFALVGDLDVSGNQITVEAMIYVTGLGDRNVVSKHSDTTNVNYLLRPHTFELSTYVSGNSGRVRFLQMFNPYSMEGGRWYHIAGTYNGSSVKYYVDGCLVIERPFSGNLVQSNFLTTIGNRANCRCEQYNGKIDEVRIWNVCRTEAQIQSNMTNLPNPTTQSGLLAYYKFANSLANAQGNTLYNAVGVGTYNYATDEGNIQPFDITNIQTQNTPCSDENGGQIVVTANRNAQYVLGGGTFQGSNTFTQLSPTTYRVMARSREGCVVERNATVGNDNNNPTQNLTADICEGQSYFGRTSSGVYVDTIHVAGTCDTFRTLNLTVRPRARQTVAQTICNGQQFERYNTGGTYIDTLRAANGCDSIRTLVLTVLPRSSSNISRTICAGQAFERYTTSGTYVDTLRSSAGCDSFRTLNLTVLPRRTTNISQTICFGQQFLGHRTSGVFVDTFRAANGCDSIRTLNLTVLPRQNMTISRTICAGQRFENYTSSGVYVDTFRAANGCDSFRTLNLTVLPRKQSTITRTICNGERFERYNTNGTYRDTLQSSTGCDSVRTLVLTVLPRKQNTISRTICAGERFENRTSSGIYIDTLRAASGCDSFRTLNLTVLPRKLSNLTRQICIGDRFERYNTSGVYVDTFRAANGCDSIRTLTLVVRTTPPTQLEKSVTICEGQSYLFKNREIQRSGVYFDTIRTAFGCDSLIEKLNLTVNPRITGFLGTDTVRVCGESSQILTSFYDQTTWFDNTMSKTKSVSTTGEYMAKYIDAKGCASLDTVFVQFFNTTFVSNVFTPNSDGVNDYFMPNLAQSAVTGFEFAVFDRWGERIFVTKDPLAEGWNGKFADRPCPTDVYVYYVTYESPVCGKILVKGDVTVVR